MFLFLIISHPEMSINLPPPFLGKYSLPTFLLVCVEQFIASIFQVFLSMIPALWSTTPTAQALMPLIRFLPFNLDLQSFLNLPIYSTVVLPFMHLGNDHERPVQLKKSRCLAVALFLNFPGALVIWWVYSTAIHIPYSFSFFSFS